MGKMGVKDDMQLRKTFRFNLAGKTIAPDAPVIDAIRQMAKNNSTCLLVQLEGDRAVGVFSEHDAVVAYAALDERAGQAKVADFMTLDIIAAQETDTVEHALKLMADHNIRHLPVLSIHGTVLDFLSIMEIIVQKAARPKEAVPA